MKHFNTDWINEWCGEHGWTDLAVVGYDTYWAFPPGAVMPEPIPPTALRMIKAQRGLCKQERRIVLAALGLTLFAAIASYVVRSPMPLVIAFCADALAAASLEVDDL
ncbi:MAG: hypothetical protein HC910_01005 [Spirulinaceae cyanobacterium SM2_1_0]|nr:hypothetical protein [Spirulinaceae cyanobacterium SM2_1_0]